MRLENVTVRFGDKVALQDFSLALTPGATTCLMGKSGCGKSTALHLMMGFIQPDAGRLVGFGGVKMAAVFQEDRLIGHLNARENVRLVLARHADMARVDAAFEQLGLSDALRQPVRTLSGGQSRRVAIARALLAPGALLLMDEPFKGLDEQSRRAAIEFVRAMGNGRTMVLVTHERKEAVWLDAEKIVEM